MKLWIPIIGQLIAKTIVAAGHYAPSASLVTLRRADSEGGTGHHERNVRTNGVFERMFQRVYESIREGDTIAQPLKESRLVDDMVVNMIDVGEETGDLDTMLNKVADVYDEEVDVMVESLISLLEPIMIVVLGGIIGTIVDRTCFMPLTQAARRVEQVIRIEWGRHSCLPRVAA